MAEVKISKAGEAVAGNPVFGKQPEGGSAEGQNGQQQQQPNEGGADPNANAGGNGNGDPGDAGKALEMTDDQLKEYFKKHNIDFNGIDDLKGKLQKAETPVAETEEQKKAREAAVGKRMLDLYLERGGKVEDFVHITKVAGGDIKELSINMTKEELKEAGFNDTQVSEILAERYYQVDPNALQKQEDESEEDFKARKELVKKKNEFGTKKLEGRATNTKKSAENILATLRQAVEQEELQAKGETEFSSKVDEFVSKVARKRTLELGEVNGQTLDPVTYEVSDADIAEVATMLKDSAKRKQFLFNQDGSLNLENLFSTMLDNKILKSVGKAAFLEGGSRQVSAFEKVFPGRSAQDVGLGGGTKRTDGQKPKIAKAGPPQVSTPTNS